MLIEALKDFAFAHLVPLVVTAFVLIAAFAAAFTFYPLAVPVLFKVVLMIAVATAVCAILSRCSLS
ncbi:hypothetical protein [Marilutibacter chinensis]|uniref:Uncharacterized protein n=1 Tax=Marilutibacter chinensis TaxID=2912247 RepID=A0ABS9HPV3_9GAMM|nr:hypothetical protein [Lysobacter chinensis]MCF7220975.1 hypothetical protein [Lysobacter chinensis]